MPGSSTLSRLVGSSRALLALPVLSHTHTADVLLICAKRTSSIACIRRKSSALPADLREAAASASSCSAAARAIVWPTSVVLRSQSGARAPPYSSLPATEAVLPACKH